MAKTVAVFNQKGGVGKTTSSINLAAGLARRKQKILLVDLDPQANTSSGLGLGRQEKSIYELLSSSAGIQEVLKSTDTKNLDIIPSNNNLAGLEIELARMDSWQNLLKDLLIGFSHLYDYIIIDCPPSLGVLSILALSASDSVIIPIQCEYYALEGVSQLFETIELVKKTYNKNLTIEGVLLSMYDGRNNLSLQVVDEVNKFFKGKVYKSVIPRNVRLAEAPSYGMTIFEYDEKSKGAEAYKSLAKEFVKRNS